MLKRHLQAYQTRHARPPPPSVPPAAKAAQKFVKDTTTTLHTLYSNQMQIDAEIRKMKQHHTELLRQSAQWEHLYDDLMHSLKEAGDLANYARVIEQKVSSPQQQQ